MSTPAPPTPPTQELRDLVAQAVAVEYLQYRQGTSEKKPESDRKPTWLQLFESAGFAALVTVLLGGLAGGLITFELQEYAKKRERQAADIRLEHDRNLTAFKEHLDRERKVVDEMFLRLGKFVDASRDLTTLSRKEFCEDCGPSRLPKRVILEKEEVVNRYNTAATDWNSNRLRLGMLLQLEHDNDAALLDEWKKTSEAAEAYAECADRWRTKYDNLEFHEALRACTSVRGTLDEALQAFTKRIVELRNSSAVAFPEKPSQ
jgi:hypothetical protein